MKTGGVKTMGMQAGTFRDWRRAAGAVGFSQFIIYILLALAGALPKFGTGLDASLVIALFSVVLVFTSNINERWGYFDVHWEDSRDTSGSLTMSWTTPWGKKRTGMIVENVEAHPDKPFILVTRSRYRPAMPASEFGSTLLIAFENASGFKLLLGFRNPDEMKYVYNQLR